jgi:Zn finger protein HypA/HybF involved in hydrogenase expression
MSLLPRQCRECGATFPGGPRAWYCPACREERRREASLLYKRQKRRGLIRNLGTLDICAVCGREYEVKGSRQKYCPSCAPEAYKAIDAIQGRIYYYANKDKITPVKNSSRRKERKTTRCIICGKEFPKHGPALSCPDCRTDFRRLSQALSDHRRKNDSQ